MIRSMTAFAAGERSTQWGTLGCEMRAVNHRFLELGVRLPDELRLLEPALRERVSTRVSRGKVDLTLRLRAGEGGGSLQVNDALLRQLGALAGDLDARFPALRTQFTELRSAEHTSELQSLMRISYDVFCLKKKNKRI